MKDAFSTMIEFRSIQGTSIACKLITPQQPVSDIPIVFLHDSLGSISVWKDFPEAVAEHSGCPCIVYDRQGYGRSGPFSGESRDNRYLEAQADFLVAFLDERQIDRCFLFGHSDGGSIALIAAAKFPGRIKGLITEGAHVFVEEVTLQGIREAITLYQSTGLKQKLEKHHGDKTDALVHAWADTWLSPAFRTWNIEHFLERISCPVLVIQGEKDEYGSEQQVDSICERVKGYAEKLVIPAIGHTPHREARQETLLATGTFTGKILAGTLQC